jgi:ABC-type branched-subunit amino acid transport system ATPase component
MVNDQGAVILAVNGVDKHFGGMVALKRTTLSVREGSITGLIGPNGSGKSTLFDIMTGYVRPDGGEVRFRGKVVSSMPPHDVARSGLIRTFQLTRIFPSLTVIENLLVCATDSRGAEAADRAAELLHFVGLTQLVEHEAATLSYGQQKLLELAQVLMLQPAMLLLDEPMAGINPGLADEIADRLRTLQGAGKTLLLVEHNLPMVTSLCDEVIVLNAGEVIAHGTPQAVVADPTVKEAFLGTSADA